MAGRYNERSWAIDLISEINAWSNQKPRITKRASGELGISGNGRNFFPDILLHGATGILQGWELKFPDTPISDGEFLSNAMSKAQILGTNSFVLWNARDAVLYVKDGVSENFKPEKSWSVPGVATRAQVEPNKAKLYELLFEILKEVERLLAHGTIVAKSPVTSISAGFAENFIELCYESDSTEIKAEMIRNEEFRLKVQLWARDSGIDPALPIHTELAKLNLLSWINKFLFAHYLASEYPILKVELSALGSADKDTTQSFFESIQERFGFNWIFANQLGDESISNDGWGARLDLNNFLCHLELNDLPRESLSSLLHSFQLETQSKGQGQYATPPKLASLLAVLAMSNLGGTVWDPCSGSGTIAKALASEKEKSGVPLQDIASQVWASDKHLMPLQLTSMALSDPRSLSQFLNLFQLDVFDSNKSGSPVLGVKFDSIASNLPFVRFESKEIHGSLAILESLQKAHPNLKLASMGRADLFASIIFSLKGSLKETGQMALLVSNSWLGTDWGISFQSALLAEFDLISVVKSGTGNWFQNAEVITTALVLKHKTGNLVNTHFVTTLEPLENWNQNYIQSVNQAAKSGVASPGIRVSTKSPSDLRQLKDLGLNWRLAFWPSTWISSISSKLVPLTKYFEVARGARRGWNALFYPDASGLKLIEPRHIKPLLKSTSNQKRLIAQTDGHAFCCSESESDLLANNEVGAHGWIQKFRNLRNGKGELLPQVLKMAGLSWYQMDANELADFCISLAPYETLAVFRFPEPTFVDQRLTRLTHKIGDLDLLHALLNSAISMMSIEFLGFGRGLGALDLSSSRVKDRMRILAIDKLDVNARLRILEAFKPLKERDILPTRLELKQVDRRTFDLVVLKEFGLEAYFDEIYEELLTEISERTASRK